MSLPPRQQVQQIVASLRRRLPGQLEGLLEHPRFAAGREALARLDDEAVAAAVAAMSPEEAEAIAAALLERWSALAEVELEPTAAIVAPDEVWIGHRPVAIPLSIEVGDGITVDEVAWDGAASQSCTTASITAQPPADDRPAILSVRAHVRARTTTARTILVATARITIRQPRILLSDDHRRLLASDHAGRPALGVVVEIGGIKHITGAGGAIELDTRAPTGAAITVAGIPAGKVT